MLIFKEECGNKIDLFEGEKKLEQGEPAPLGYLFIYKIES